VRAKAAIGTNKKFSAINGDIAKIKGVKKPSLNYHAKVFLHGSGTENC